MLEHVSAIFLRVCVREEREKRRTATFYSPPHPLLLSLLRFFCCPIECEKSEQVDKDGVIPTVRCVAAAAVCCSLSCWASGADERKGKERRENTPRRQSERKHKGNKWHTTDIRWHNKVQCCLLDICSSTCIGHPLNSAGESWISTNSIHTQTRETYNRTSKDSSQNK